MELEDQGILDLKTIKEEASEHFKIKIESVVELPFAYILKSQKSRIKNYDLKKFRAIFVEYKNERQQKVSVNLNNKQSNAQQILCENTLEVNSEWRTSEYVYKQSAYYLYDINQWMICLAQQKDSIQRILNIIIKVFSLVHKLWLSEKHEISLQFENIALNEDNNIVIFNQSNISDEQQEKHQQEVSCIKNFGSFLGLVLQNVSSVMKGKTQNNLVILNSCCNLIRLIFQDQILNVEQIRVHLFETITLAFFTEVNIENQYVQSFEQFKARGEEVRLSTEYRERNIDFDFEKVMQIENECLQNLKDNKKVLENLLILSQIYSRSYRKYGKSMEYLETALKMNPYDVEILIGYMMIFIQKRQSNLYSVIRYSLISLSYIFHDSWKIYYLIAWLYDRDALFKESKLFIQKTKKFNNTDPQVVSLDAIIHLSQKHNNFAQELIDKALSLNVMHHPIVYFRKGYILDDLGIDDSLQWYAQSLKVDPYAADIYFNIAYYYSEKDNINESIVQYNKCIEIDPLYVNAYLNQENNYSRIQDYAKQRECLEKAISIDPSNFKAYVNLGVCEEQQSRYTEAISLWQKAIALNPQHPDAFGLIAYRLYSNDDIPASIWYYKKYQQFNKHNEKEAIFSLSVLNHLNKDYEQSEIYAQTFAQSSSNLDDISSVFSILYSPIDDIDGIEAEEDLDDDEEDDID